MGCHRCSECDGKFEAYTAEEYAGSDGEADYETCPDCLDKEAQKNAKNAQMKQLQLRVAELEAQLKQAKRVTAEPQAPKAKRQKASLPASVWIITKADHAEQHAHVARCEVIGTYLSKAAAEQAKEEFLEEGGWQEGYGYHQGEEESAIEICESTLHHSQTVQMPVICID